MYDYFADTEPWTGLLTAFGIALVLFGLGALRGASDRVRAVAAMAGVVLAGSVIVRSFGAVVAVVGLVAAGDFPGSDGEGGRRVLDVILVASGVTTGVFAVLYAHARLDTVVADAAYDDVVTEEPGDDDLVDGGSPLDDEPDRDAAAGGRTWIGFGALALAMSLPVASVGPFGFGSVSNVYGSGDVTAMIAVSLVVSGIVLAGALLVVARRDDADPRLLAGGFGLVALRAIVVPIWPETFANEFWNAFGFGLAAGLVMAGVFGLVREAIPEDRSLVVFGSLVAIALLALSTSLTYRSLVSDSFGDAFESGEIDDSFDDDTDVYPTGFPTELLPTDFPTFAP